MSDPIDARFLREMVRELSSEEPKPIDWERVEEKLFARLEDEGAPGSGALGSGLVGSGLDTTEGGPFGEDQDEADELALSGFGERISEVGLGLMDPALLASAQLDGSSDDRLSVAPGAARAKHPKSDASELGDRISSPYVAARGASEMAGDNDFSEKTGRATIHVPSFGHSAGPNRAREEQDTDRARATKGRRAGDRTVEEPGRARRFTGVGVLVAAAACFAFFVGGLVAGGSSGKNAPRSGETAEITAERWVDPTDVPMAPGLAGAHDLGALRAGDMVEATAGAVSFGRTDKATQKFVSWTLAPGSRVFVRGGVDDPRHVLVLESGSIRADFVGASTPTGGAGGVVDPLVVEAGDTRVAVQSSLFSVTRSSKGIVVDVERGLAIVGPREELGLGSGRLLHEAESGVFSLDGGRIFKSLVPVRTALQPVRTSFGLDGASLDPSVASPVRAPEVGTAEVAANEANDAPSGHPVAGRPPLGSRSFPAEPSPAESATSVSGPSAGPGEVVAAEPPMLSEGTIHASLDRCFAQVEAQHKAKGAPDDGVALTMRSTLRLRVADDGAIKGASFNPPLRPDLQSCAVSLLSGRVAPGARTLEVPVEIRH